MKVLAKVVILIAIASICYGFTNEEYEVVSYKTEKVMSSMSIWEISNKHYDNGHAGRMCFEEYMHRVRHDSYNEPLTSNGRILQIGDVVMVPHFRVKK